MWIFFNRFNSEWGNFHPWPFGSNKPQNAHSGGVFLYYKHNLPVKQRKDLEIISETVGAELTLEREKMFVVLSYRHPNQKIRRPWKLYGCYKRYYQQIKAEKSIDIVLTGDFNARSPLFWENDTATREGRMFSDFLLSNEALINELMI